MIRILSIFGVLFSTIFFLFIVIQIVWIVSFSIKRVLKKWWKYVQICRPVKQEISKAVTTGFVCSVNVSHQYLQENNCVGVSF